MPDDQFVRSLHQAIAEASAAASSADSEHLAADVRPHVEAMAAGVPQVTALGAWDRRVDLAIDDMRATVEIAEALSRAALTNGKGK